MINPVQSPGSSARWLALLVLCTGMLMIVLDDTIVTVALPSIQRDLGFSQSTLAWVVNAYLIPFGGLLLLTGRIGDLIGRKRVFTAGLAVFTTASLLCGVSGSQGMLIAARLLQGVGGAMTQTVILSVIVTMFPKAREQARAIGVFSFTAAAGGSFGLLAGGVLTQAVNWHWIFFRNVPIGIVAVLLALRLIESDRGIGLRQGADVIGAVFATSSLMLGVYVIVEEQGSGWTSPRTLGLGAATVVLIAGFLVRQATAANPLLSLRLLRSRTVAAANLIQIPLAAGMFGMCFLCALYLQLVLHYDPLQIGLAFLPMLAVTGALSFRFAPQLVARFSARPVLLVGLALLAAGLALLARAPLGATYVIDILPAMLLIGVGNGVAFQAVMTLGMSGATESDAGLVSGLLNTTGQIGCSLGLALLATLASSRTEQLLAGGQSLASARTDGYHVAFVAAAVLVAAAVAVAAIGLRPEAPTPVHALAVAPAPEVEPLPLGMTRVQGGGGVHEKPAPAPAFPTPTGHPSGGSERRRCRGGRAPAPVPGWAAHARRGAWRR